MSSYLMVLFPKPLEPVSQFRASFSFVRELSDEQRERLGVSRSGDSPPLPAAASVGLAGVILLANRFCDGSQLLNPASGVQGIFIRHWRVEQVAKSDSDNGREQRRGINGAV